MSSILDRPDTPSRSHHWWRTLGVWLISAALLGAVLSKYDLRIVIRALGNAHWVAYLSLVLGFAGVTLLIEGWFLARAYTWLARPIRFLDMVRARGACYVLAIVSAFVGMGGLLLFTKKKYGVSYRRGSAVMLLEVYLDVFSMGLLCLLASQIASGASSIATPQITGAGRFGLGAVLFCLAVLALSHILRRRKPTATGHRKILHLSELSPAQFAELLASKIVQNLIHGLFVVLALSTFGIEAPWLLAFAFSQIIRTARGLPITAFGLGVDQLGFVTLFGPWDPGTGGQVLALSLAYTVSMVAARGLVGLTCLPSALNLPDQPEAPEPDQNSDESTPSPFHALDAEEEMLAAHRPLSQPLLEINGQQHTD